MKQLHKGDDVSWNTPQGMTNGTVSKKVTSDSSIAGHHAKANNRDPQYEVTSKKSGKKAIHKPDSLNKT